MTKQISFKRFFSLLLTVITALTAMPTLSASAEENYYGGQGWAYYTEPVYDSTSWTNQIGTIYQHEGYTILHKNYDNYYVEYSTSNGPKRGYVQHDPGEYPMGVVKSCVAKITATSTVYYGPDPSRYKVAGTVYSGEFVTVIGRNDYPVEDYVGGWIYIEYNTTSGRKRGYMVDVNNTMYNRPSVFPDFYMWQYAGTDAWITGSKTVYAGPSNQYAAIGSVANENVTVLGHTDYMGYQATYIEYNAGTKRKSGFLIGWY